MSEQGPEPVDLYQAWLRAIQSGGWAQVQVIEDEMRRLDPPSREVTEMQQEYARTRAEAGHGFTCWLEPEQEVRAAA